MEVLKMGKFINYVEENCKKGSLREQFVNGIRSQEDLPRDDVECKKEIENAIKLYFALKYK